MFLIERLDALIEQGRRFPGTNAVMVDKVAATDLIEQLRVAVPEEVRQAKRINEESSRLVERAQDEAERIIARAQDPRSGSSWRAIAAAESISMPLPCNAVPDTTTMAIEITPPTAIANTVSARISPSRASRPYFSRTEDACRNRLYGTTVVPTSPRISLFDFTGPLGPSTSA